MTEERRHVDQVTAHHPESSLSPDKEAEPPEASRRDEESETPTLQPDVEPQSLDEQANQQSSVPERLDLPGTPPVELHRSAREQVSLQHSDYIR